GLIQAHGREAATIGAEGHAPEPAHMAAQAQDLFPSPGVPDLYFPVAVHRKIAAGRGQSAAVGVEGHHHQASLGVTAGEPFLARLRVPYLDRLVAARGEPPAVGTELDASDPPGKAAQRERLLTGVQVPNLHFPFLYIPTACGGQALTVRAESYPPH